MQAIRKFFEFEKHKTNFKTEFLAGLTSFITMAYVMIVNPKILSAAGMDFGASITATILITFVGCLLMGFYAKLPMAVAPYMGENAFIAYVVVLSLGISWQIALGCVFLAGAFFFILTALNIRSWLVNSMPKNLKYSFSVGLGLFLTFLGLLQTGIIRPNGTGAPLHVGNLSEPTVILALLGFFIIAFLMVKKVKAAILIGILSITILAIILGYEKIPESIFSAPPSLEPLLGKMDIAGALKFENLYIVFILFIMVYVDTMGTLIGTSYRAGLLDENGNLPDINKPMYCDAATTMLAGFVGTTTSGAYLESATGIEAGGKSGLTAITVGCLFLLGLFFAPLFQLVPPYAYGPALLIVGMLMISTIKEINFEDMSEFIPAFCTIILMVFTYNIGIGMAAGFALYPILKLISGKNKDNNPAIWILCVLSLIFFALYPY